MQSSIADKQNREAKRGVNLRGLLQVCLGVGALALQPVTAGQRQRQRDQCYGDRGCAGWVGLGHRLFLDPVQF